MPGVPFVRPHGVGVGGATLARGSQLFEGRFGRIFRALPPADFGNNEQDIHTNLNALGAAMLGGDDAPKDGPDAEESGIPAIYTYFGQFIDHDLTFDPASELRCNGRMIRTPTWTTSMAAGPTISLTSTTT